MDNVLPYVDVVEAQSYFDDSRLNAESWDNSTTLMQLKALKAATIAIDRLSFKGTRFDDAQPNEFPRVVGQIPNDIKIACCEIALSLLDGVDPDLEEEDLGSIVESYATVRVTSDPNIRKDNIRAGIPSVVAWKHLLPYLNDPLSLHIRRG